MSIWFASLRPAGARSRAIATAASFLSGFCLYLLTAAAAAAQAITVTPGDFSSNVVQGGTPSPLSQAYTITNVTAATIYLPVTAYSPAGQSVFFDVTNIPAILGPSASTTITVTIRTSANSLAPGTYTGAVDFGNAANLAAGLIAFRNITLTVTAQPPPPTQTALTSSLNPSVAGQSVRFTATVTSTAGTPSGSVAFKDGATQIGAGTLSAGGVATLDIANLAVGTHQITAAYGGATGFPASTSPAVAQVVNAQLTTTTTISAAPNPSTARQAVTLAATVSAPSGTPTGTVTFKDGATILGSGTLSGTTATFSTNALTAGSHQLTAVYGGATNYQGSTSAPQAQVVNPYSGLPQAITMSSAATTFEPPVRVEPLSTTAYATVILLPGGTGLLSLDAAGIIAANDDDYLARSANEFLRRGLNVVLPDSAPAFSSGLSTLDRLSNPHVSQVQGFITAARDRWGLPVWVAGFGNSAISGVSAGALVPTTPGFAGVVLLSPLTDLSSTPTNQSIFNGYVNQMTKPAAVLWHALDLCTVSPPGGSSALVTALAATTKTAQAFNGGHRVLTDPCGALSQHGFAGIETVPVTAAAAFIRANTASAPAAGLVAER